MNKNMILLRVLLAALLMMGFPVAAPANDAELETPTLELRQEAQAEFDAGDRMEGLETLLEAAELAREQENLYVQANELRYIAEAFAANDSDIQARKHFADAMDVANRIPTWNHRLYASIGILEVQRGTKDLQGVHDNGLKALDSGLLEAIDAIGESAEMGRFLTAMDGVLTSEERTKLKQKISGLKTPELKAKSLHALSSLSVKKF